MLPEMKKDRNEGETQKFSLFLLCLSRRAISGIGTYGFLEEKNVLVAKVEQKK
jgi:hypothetical protein